MLAFINGYVTVVNLFPASQRL